MKVLQSLRLYIASSADAIIASLAVWVSPTTDDLLAAAGPPLPHSRPSSET